VRKILFLTIITFFFTGCGREEIVRFYGPEVRADVEIISGKAGLIRSFYADVLVEHVQDEDWEHISSFPFLRGEGSVYPVEPVFHVIIENTWNKPFIVTGVYLLCGSRRINPQYFDSYRDKNFPEKRYSVNLKELWEKRRILNRGELVRDIDFKNNTVIYSLDFIAPGDRVSEFYLFNSVPARCGSVKLAVAIKYLDMEKVIDFDITRVIYSR
jgi:hypothetical protein